MEQGSYLLITPGMAVHNGAGENLGKVAEVVAESGMDIFRGLILSPGLLAQNVFVPQDRVVAVADNGVTVDVGRDEVAHLRPADGTI